MANLVAIRDAETAAQDLVAAVVVVEGELMRHAQPAHQVPSSMRNSQEFRVWQECGDGRGVGRMEVSGENLESRKAESVTLLRAYAAAFTSIALSLTGIPLPASLLSHISRAPLKPGNPPLTILAILVRPRSSTGPRALIVRTHSSFDPCDRQGFPSPSPWLRVRGPGHAS